MIVPAEVSRQKGPLEFLLCTEQTRDYESLLKTKVQPHSLHAALLTLGLLPGKPAQWSNPAGEKPVFMPPRGAELELTLRWKDDKGVAHEAPATDWLITAQNKPAPATRWVFVGSENLDDGRYWADVEGRTISLANFAASVIDVPFKSSDKNALLEYAANDKAVPAEGTAVDLVITAVKGAESAPVARITFTVDAFGRLDLDGLPVAPDKVVETVKKYVAVHPQCAAEVRLDARALVYDRERLRLMLEEAGVTDVNFRPQLSGELLPRTRQEAAQALAWWKDQFANAKDLLSDPAEDAEATLKQIQRRQREIQADLERLDQYARQLQGLVEEYKKNQPATQPSAEAWPAPAFP